MADVPLFEIEDLHVSTPDTETGSGVEILKGVSLRVNAGEVHALMGPNGSGKSVLAAALLGSPRYVVTSGTVRFQGDDITTWATDVRAKAGLFLAFQNPEEISGVTVLSFLRQALSARRGIEMSVPELRQTLLDWMERLGIDPSFMERHVNDGFSGGEMKRSEILQMALLEPDMAILDESAAGLDIKGLQTVANGIQTIRAERPNLGTLFITHHQLLLEHLKPDHAHVLVDGRIVASGGPELALQLETDGYESFT
ncbi:MAG: Fe-S cluster assembly ATPase SufC [Acidimicrobiales bacterium]